MVDPTRLPKIGLTGPPSDITQSDSSLQGFVAKLPVVATTSEQNTTIILPANAIEAQVVVNVLTAEVTGSNKIISIGIAGTPGVLIGELDVSAVGVFGKTGGAGSGEQAFPVNLGGKTIVYILGSTNFVELVAEVILYVITVEPAE